MKLLRAILLALLASLVAGLLVGTILRLRLDRPQRYLVEAGPAPSRVARQDPGSGWRRPNPSASLVRETPTPT